MKKWKIKYKVSLCRDTNFYILFRIRQMWYMSYHSPCWSPHPHFLLYLHWHSGITARCRVGKCFHGTLGWLANANSVEGLTQHQSVATSLTNPWLVLLLLQQTKAPLCPSREHKPERNTMIKWWLCVTLCCCTHLLYFSADQGCW